MSGFIVGIDPGASGAIALLDYSASIHEIHDMPVIEMMIGKSKRKRVSEEGFIALFEGLTIDMVVIEKVGGITGQSASAAFTFGESCGLIRGAVAGMRIPRTFLPAQRWKKAAGLPADKGAARMMAQQIWPIQAKLFSRVRDDGRAEAALIARHYCNTIGRIANGSAT